MTVVLAARYELDRRLGRGGMAEVWRGRDLVLGRRIAVKTVSVTDATDVTLGDRLRREAVATAALDHPDIVTVHDAGVDGDTAFLVMELVAGRNLAAVLADGALPLAEAVRIGGRVAGALAAAHASGIVHRDIKPANIIVKGDKVTVVDFGIAAIEFQAVTSLTAPGTTLGTAEYMAPEQARAEPATSGTDMYSFGCLLTALVAGRPPFTAEQPVAVLHHHAFIQPPRLRRLRPDVPEELDALVGALLDKDPAARPTATEAHVRLARIAEALSPTPAVRATVAGAVVVDSPPTAASPVMSSTGESTGMHATARATAAHGEGSDATAAHDASTGATAVHDETATAALNGVSTATFAGVSTATLAARTTAVDAPAPEPVGRGARTREEPSAPEPAPVRQRGSSGRRRRRVLVGAAAAVAAGIVAFSATEGGASRTPEPVAKLLFSPGKVLVADAEVTAEPVATAVASPAPTEAPTVTAPSAAPVAPAPRPAEEPADAPVQEAPGVTGKGQGQGGDNPAAENNGRTGKGQNSNSGKGR
ncbi:protein kinase [Georgenia sp. EYE_87]|uniref:serine/threonine-protein kinase n=1 Tax=Georgenia sp. EYE_87 TaxID=2853448 RepID=UPI0020043BAD|nr:serine/threonine-protein kinase [Georgenia sp. EYE_87]MCK6210706.1 protein kinase [Georgenia sp. EYE_87]